MIKWRGVTHDMRTFPGPNLDFLFDGDTCTSLAYMHAIKSLCKPVYSLYTSFSGTHTKLPLKKIIEERNCVSDRQMQYIETDVNLFTYLKPPNNEINPSNEEIKTKQKSKQTQKDG